MLLFADGPSLNEILTADSLVLVNSIFVRSEEKHTMYMPGLNVIEHSLTRAKVVMLGRRGVGGSRDSDRGQLPLLRLSSNSRPRLEAGQA